MSLGRRMSQDKVCPWSYDLEWDNASYFGRPVQGCATRLDGIWIGEIWDAEKGELFGKVMNVPTRRQSIELLESMLAIAGGQS